MAQKRPIMISLGRGHMGRFVQKIPYGNGNCTVEFTTNFKRKGGLFASTSYLKNIPEAAVTEVIFPSGDEDGIPKEGIVFVLTGEFGDTWLADRINMHHLNSLAIMSEQVKTAKIQQGTLQHEKRALSKGAEEDLRRIDETRGLMGIKDKRRSGENFPPEPEDI